MANMGRQFYEKVLTSYKYAHPKDYGKHGKGYEGIVKYIIRNYKGAVCSKAGRPDLMKKIDGYLKQFECKTNCGKVIDGDTDIRNAPYVIYCYEWAMEKGVEYALYNSVVFNGADFYELLKVNKRLHKPQMRVNKDGTEVLVQNIQEYRNSKTAQRVMLDIITQAPTLYDFLIDNGINFNDN
jgi:hypothetical protein